MVVRAADPGEGERLPRRFGPVGVEHSDEGARGGEETEPAARLREEHAPVRRPRRPRARVGRVAGQPADVRPVRLRREDLVLVAAAAEPDDAREDDARAVRGPVWVVVVGQVSGVRALVGFDAFGHVPRLASGAADHGDRAALTAVVEPERDPLAVRRPRRPADVVPAHAKEATPSTAVRSHHEQSPVLRERDRAAVRGPGGLMVARRAARQPPKAAPVRLDDVDPAGALEGEALTVRRPRRGAVADVVRHAAAVAPVGADDDDAVPDLAAVGMDDEGDQPVAARRGRRRRRGQDERNRQPCQDDLRGAEPHDPIVGRPGYGFVNVSRGRRARSRRSSQRRLHARRRAPRRSCRGRRR